MRQPFDAGQGITYTRTELDNVISGKDACPEAIAAADIDGDGSGDLVAIESPGYSYESQELVALHGPSGKVAWRAGKGQLGKRLALSDGVVVVESDDEATLHGVEARTGRMLWSTPLPATLVDDPYGQFGMTWNAPALTDIGQHVAFGCDDGTVHVLEAKTGRLVVSREGRLLEPGHGIPGVVAFLGGEMTEHEIDVWDVANNRSILHSHMQSFAPMALGMDGTFFVFFADTLPNGAVMTRAVSFDLATKQRRKDVWVTTGRDNVVPHNGLLCDPHRMAVLGMDRLVVASDDKERGGGIVIDLNAKPAGTMPPSVIPVSRMPPPQAGYVLRALESFRETVVAVWEHEKSHQLIALGFDRSTLEPRWFVGDAGGADLKNHALRTESALLLPFAPQGKTEHTAAAPVYWCHVDPSTGARVAQYAVHELDCVRMHGKYLLGHSTSFPGVPPVLWDTERRERAL